MTPVADNKTVDPAPEFNRHPLVKFWGDVVDINDSVEHNDNTNKDNTFIIFDIADVEVLEANEPYNAPTTQLRFMELNFPKTDWDVMRQSIIAAGFPTGTSLNELIGKRCLFEFAPAKLNRRDRDTGKYRDVDAHSWQIKEIKGVENTAAELMEKILAHADGKTEPEFKAAFLSDMSLPTLTNFGVVANQVMGGTFLDAMVATNQLTKDANGVYRRP